MGLTQGRHAVAEQPLDDQDSGSDSDSLSLSQSYDLPLSLRGWPQHPYVTGRQSEAISSVPSIVQSQSSEELVQKPMVEQEVERCKLLTGLDVRSMLMCNVYKGSEHVGVIQVVNKKGSPEFSSADEHLAQVFAANVAVAVSNSTLYYRTEQSQRLLSTILDSIPSTVLTFSRAGHV